MTTCWYTFYQATRHTAKARYLQMKAWRQISTPSGQQYKAFACLWLISGTRTSFSRN